MSNEEFQILTEKRITKSCTRESNGSLHRRYECTLRKDVYSGYFDGWYTLRCYQMQREGREVKSFAMLCHSAATAQVHTYVRLCAYIRLHAHTHTHTHIYLYIHVISNRFLRKHRPTVFTLEKQSSRNLCE